jgi:septal ring factor EnvC (AmiA/AmiB activator)
MKSRWLAPVAAALLLGASTAQSQPAEKPAPRARPAARPSAGGQVAEERAFLNQLAEAQRALGDQLQQIRERVDAVHAELAARADADTAIQDELKALRDEVKGLYVESSTVKQQIDELKEDVAGVDSNVSAFRTLSGFFVGIMTLLLAAVLLQSILRR